MLIQKPIYPPVQLTSAQGVRPTAPEVRQTATSGAGVAGRSPAADSADVRTIPDESFASPNMQAALKAAEEARASLLAQGVTPTMSVSDAAKLIALLSD